jgi:flagellin
MSELASLATDVTKDTDDIANYELEYTSLQGQLDDLALEEFNGIALLDGGDLEVAVKEDGTTTTITEAAFTTVNTGFGALGGATDEVLAVSDAIIALGTLRAQNGSDQSRLTFAGDMLAVNKTNLEAANSRIIDVDVAAESTQLARFNILQQSGTAMLAQANQSTQSILRLLV